MRVPPKQSNPNRTSSSGQIRIIAGQWRGRKLPVLDKPGLRPTTDRIKETVFNWLAPIIHGASCLDCFAGSGALGLEALSRYAQKSVMLEADRAVAQQLQRNLACLNSSQGSVVHTDTLKWLAKPGEPYDIIFLDPPFRKGILQHTITLLEENGWLNETAWIYLETEREQLLLDLPDTWILYREKTAGQVSYRLYQRQTVSQPALTGVNYVD